MHFCPHLETEKNRKRILLFYGMWPNLGLGRTHYAVRRLEIKKYAVRKEGGGHPPWYAILLSGAYSQTDFTDHGIDHWQFGGQVRFWHDKGAINVMPCD